MAPLAWVPWVPKNPSISEQSSKFIMKHYDYVHYAGKAFYSFIADTVIKGIT